MAAANGNGNHPRRDGSALLGEAGDISDAAHVISRLAGEVSNGADSQARALDTALLGESARQLVAGHVESGGIRGQLGRKPRLVDQRDGCFHHASQHEHGQPDQHHPRRGRLHPGKPRLDPEREQPDAGDGRHRAAGQHVHGRDGGVGERSVTRATPNRWRPRQSTKAAALDRGNHPVDSGSGPRAPRTSPLPRNRPPRRSARRPPRLKK